MQLGDGNNHYFFSVMKQRQSRYRIDVIYTEQGVLLKTPAAIEDEITEIDLALKGIDNTKARGIDGFNCFFFKRAWNIVKSDVYASVMHFFNTGNMMRHWNCTTVTVVPKVQNPSYAKDYRPIVCCLLLSSIRLLIVLKLGLNLVDLKKSYDSVELSFLKTVIAELSFPAQFISWIRG
ncbi:uncharacterized protein LOC110695588 [Chenopodium quinoa]|uniref:uncharacterized protein LOC110695588 n=1 Tax=Chenopodium quinoa TaxID=63459 RepID=UPI000B781267|nr:uncharacterized protein LOC110695588 [Chenopodium quinoa]